MSSAPGGSQPAASAARRVENPVQGDVSTFLDTSEETGGERTLVELEVAPGDGVRRHFHRSYAEHFRGREGRLIAEVAGDRRELGPGEEAVAAPGAVHALSNRSAERAVARVEVRPGHPASRRPYGSATASPPTGAPSGTGRRATRSTWPSFWPGRRPP